MLINAKNLHVVCCIANHVAIAILFVCLLSLWFLLLFCRSYFILNIYYLFVWMSVCVCVYLSLNVVCFFVLMLPLDFTLVYEYI